MKSIGIEICYSKSGGERFDKAERLAAEYVAYLLKQYGWGIDRVKKHQDWSGKYCPHRTLDRGWQRFLNMVKSYMGGKPTPTPTPSKYTPGSYEVTADVLNVRAGAGTNNRIVTKINRGSKQGVDRVSGDWGHLMNDAGWINLNYCKKITTPNTPSKPSLKYTPGSYQVTTDTLNVRKEPNTSSKIVARIHKGSKQGVDRTQGDWGHLMNNAGWICLNYCKKI